jgi:hypothetical protein
MPGTACLLSSEAEKLAAEGWERETKNTVALGETAYISTCLTSPCITGRVALWSCKVSAPAAVWGRRPLGGGPGAEMRSVSGPGQADRPTPRRVGPDGKVLVAA